MLSSHSPTNGFETDLGARVRALRRERGLTLKGLGRLAGLSHPFLSQVERGLARPSVELGRADRRGAGRVGRPPLVAAAPGRRRAGRSAATSVEPDAAAALRELPGEPGAPGPARVVRARPPLARGVRRSHDGEVAIYVARGVVEVDLDGDVHELDEGDALRFDGSTPHRLRRAGGTTRAR